MEKTQELQNRSLWSRLFKPVRLGTRLALLAGFGGLLALMTFTASDSMHALGGVEADNYLVVQSYLAHHRTLDQLRTLIYLSVTAMRDYFLETDPLAAEANLKTLKDLREEMASSLQECASTLRPEEQAPFAELQAESAEFWKSLASIPRGDHAFRNAFLKAEVFPHATAAFRAVDAINEVNRHAVRKGDRQLIDLFNKYRWRVIAVLVAALCLGTILAVLIAKHLLHMERESRANYEEAVRTRSELQKLSARLLDVQEEERRTISRELHDEVGQSLSALLLDLGNLAAVTAAENAEAHRLLATAKKLAENSVNAARNMSLLLRPSMLDDLGLVPAMRWQAREVSRRTGIRIDVVADNVADELPEGHKTCIYRVVQEALHNAASHAQAQAVRIEVKQEPERLLLTVQDEGKGFDPAQTRGMGLIGMEERVKRLRGTFQVRSRPGQGTTLSIELPLSASAAMTAEEVGV